ncbi:hypothetical protein ES706_04807 [subsurface metagenome]
MAKERTAELLVAKRQPLLFYIKLHKMRHPVCDNINVRRYCWRLGNFRSKEGLVRASSQVDNSLAVTQPFGIVECLFFYPVLADQINSECRSDTAYDAS